MKIKSNDRTEKSKRDRPDRQRRATGRTTFRELMTNSTRKPDGGPSQTPQNRMRPARLEPSEAPLSDLERVGREAQTQQEEAGATFAADGSLDGRAPSESLDPTRCVQAPEPVTPARAESIPTLGPATAPRRSGELEQLVSKLVEKLAAGEDARARKTVVMQIDAGANGRVAVRLRREGDSYRLRMRPTNPDFAVRLDHAQDDLRRSAAKKGLRFTQIDVVR